MKSNANKSLIWIFTLFSLAGIATAAGLAANAGSDQSVNIYDTVTFSGAASTCSGCSIVSYNWNFGDGQGVSGVSTTHSYNTSAVYTVTLVVISNQGQISSDTMSVTVSSSDSIAPVITHTPTTTGTNNITITIYTTITDNVGISTATLYYKRANESSYSSTAMSGSGTTYSGTIPATYVTMANVNYYLEALDAASNTACKPASSAPCSSSSYSITISSEDTTPPSTSLTSVSADTLAPYYDISNDGATTIRVSGESGMSCRHATSDATYGNMSSSNICVVTGSQANCSLSLSQGSYIYYVSCKDGANNSQSTSQNIDVNFTVDWTAPSGGSLNATAIANGSINLVWAPATDNVSGLSIQKLYRNGTLKLSLSANSMAWTDTSTVDGTNYNYSICGTDNAGNVQSNATCMSASATATTDSTAPIVTAISSSASGSNVTLSVVTNEVAICRFATSNLDYSSMTSITNSNSTSHSVSITYNSTTSGTYYVRCRDSAGNAMTSSNSTPFSITISAGAPTPPTQGPSPSLPVAVITPTLSVLVVGNCAGDTFKIIVKDEDNNLLAGATVLIKSPIGEGVIENSYTTDATGEVAFIPDKGNYLVFVSSTGYTTAYKEFSAVLCAPTAQNITGCAYDNPQCSTEQECVDNICVSSSNITNVTQITPAKQKPIVPAKERELIVTKGGAIISIPSIAAESRASVSIIAEVTAVTGIQDIILTSKKEMKNIKLTVDKLDAKPVAVSDPQKPVYRYIEIKTENITSENLESATIKFVIEKSWFGTNYNVSSVTMMRHTTAWTELPTTLVDQNSTHYIYEATTPGFSYFAITAQETVTTPSIIPITVLTQVEEFKWSVVTRIIVGAILIGLFIIVYFKMFKITPKRKAGQKQLSKLRIQSQNPE